MALGVLPVDRFHKSVDVGCGLGAEIDVIGVLVHIERQDRRAAGQRVAMICGPLIDELAIMGGPGQQHPARAAAECLSHCNKFSAPARERAKVPNDGITQRATRLALIPQPVEEYLVKGHRVHRDRLFALESIDEKTRRIGKIEFAKLLLDEIEALHRASVIVLVVADNADMPLMHVGSQDIGFIWYVIASRLSSGKR
jgi:hypothetical protein